MNINRRHFVKKIAVSSALLSISPFVFKCSAEKKKLDILVLGGTLFVGPAIVNAALNEGHRVTLFNRGITNPQLFTDLPLVKGDRNEGISSYRSLQNKQWDVVIDVWPQKSKLVEEATQALKDHAEHYIFISSIAVYANFQEVGLHEESEVLPLPNDPSEWYYGEEKLAAENIIKERFPDKHTILRAGPIVGWRDPAYDLSYWLLKLKNNQSVLAPGSGKDPIQFIDVKDIGRFTIFSIEHSLSGVYNLTGPLSRPLLWNEFLDLTKEHLSSDSELFWANEDFLRENSVRSFEDLPLWAPLSEDRGFMQISAQKAIATGFSFSPVTATIDDCLSWFEKNTKNTSLPGLERSRELELIEKWKNL